MKTLLFDVSIYIVFSICLFSGVKLRCDNEEVLLKNLNGLRGIFALEVLVGHVVQYQDGTILRPLSLFMMCSVGFFFFISAYSMTYKLNHSENYLSFLLFLKKAGYLIIVTLLVYLFACFVALFTKNGPWYFEEFKPFLLGFFDRTNWYIWILILFYFFFYLIGNMPRTIRVLVMCLLIFIISILEAVAGWQERYYISSLCFPFGMLYGDSREWFERKKNRIIILIVGKAGVVLGGLTFLYELNPIESCICKNSFCISVILGLVFICKYLIFSNKILKLLNDISLEIFLFSFVWISALQGAGFEYELVLVGTVVLTLISGVIIGPLFKKIKLVIYRR